MILRYMAFPLMLIVSSIAVADASDRVELTPQESVHQFAFFNTSTPVWSYNGQIPGPILKGREGTTLQVDVLNRLKEPTSIHWHGLRIDNAMDGVPGVTQSAIEPGNLFSYRLKLQEAGTYWYHPHFNAGEQLERGLKGVLIVEEHKKLPFTQDVVWLLDDWLFMRDGQIYPHFNTHRDLMHDGRWGNVVTVNGKRRPELLVTPGERIRLRVINGANARIFSQSLKGLPARVMAVDGRPVSESFNLERFILSPGNRIDLDITIPSDAAGKTFYLEDRFTRQPLILGSIKVEDVKPSPTPKFDLPLAGDFIPAKLFDNLPVSKTWDLSAIRGGKYGIGWTLNHRLWPNSDKAAFKIGQPVRIRFVNSSPRLHPMHIHGAFFRVLEVNGQTVEEPFTRDTVLVGPDESMVIGLVPEHKGIWLAHCHIQAHAESGMMTTVTFN